MSDESVHRWTLPENLGGLEIGVRELTVPQYEALLSQASKALKDSDVEEGKIGAMMTVLKTKQQELLRISCLAYHGRDTAFDHDGGPQGLVESLSYKQTQFLDRAISTLHDLTTSEAAAFDKSHCPPGAVATSPRLVPEESGKLP